MANVNEKFAGRFLKANVDVHEDQPLNVTISEVTEELVGVGRDAENKLIVWFRELDKGLVLNKTNATTIANLYGPETDDWAGKRITLFWAVTEYQGKPCDSIRVRSKAPADRKPAAARPKAPVEEIFGEVEADEDGVPIDAATGKPIF